MRITLIAIVAAVAVGLVAPTSLNAQTAPAPAETKTSPAAKTLVTVGANKITQGQLDGVLMQVPEFKRSAFTQEALARLTQHMVQREFVQAHNLPVDEEVFAKMVEEMKRKFQQEVIDVRTRLALGKYVRERISKENLQKYVEAHPHFFDGTKVEVSRILIKCSIHDSSADQLAARNKLARILNDVQARKIPFAVAAATYSDCPSKAKNGQLGELEFGGPAKEAMLKIASFMTEEGQISPIIRTGAGWEAVLVTKIERGDGEPQPWKDPLNGTEMTPDQLARRAIIAMIESQILTSTVEGCEVVNHTKKAPAAAKK